MHTADTPSLQYGVYASETEPYRIVKVVKEGSSEVQMYDILLSDLNDPANHTLPCEIIRSDPPLLIMPIAEDSRSLRTAARTFDSFYQILEVSDISKFPLISSSALTG